MTHTYTRTYVIVSRHWAEFIANLKCRWLNKRDKRSRPIGLGSGNYMVERDPEHFRSYMIVDWGGQ